MYKNLATILKHDQKIQDAKKRIKEYREKQQKKLNPQTPTTKKIAIGNGIKKKKK